MSEITERSWDLSNYEVNREAQGVIKTSTNIAVSSKVRLLRGGEVRAWMGCDVVDIFSLCTPS